MVFPPEPVPPDPIPPEPDPDPEPPPIPDPEPQPGAPRLCVTRYGAVPFAGTTQAGRRSPFLAQDLLERQGPSED